MHLAPRDQALLGGLDRTPLTAALVVNASVVWPQIDSTIEPFRDERRARERLQALAHAPLVKGFSLAVVGGGLGNYYRLTPEGYRVLHGVETPLPHRSFFSELTPSRLAHTLDLAEAIEVHDRASSRNKHDHIGMYPIFEIGMTLCWFGSCPIRLMTVTTFLHYFFPKMKTNNPVR